MAPENFKRQEKSLGELLTDAGLITKEVLEEALEEQQQTGEPLGKILIRKNAVTEEDIVAILKGMLVVVFGINNEMFGLEIVYTREILKEKKITSLPSMPAYVRGVITLRDMVVPVIDLRKKIFGERSEDNQESKIIIVETNGKTAGALVERVVAVRNFQSKEVEYSSAINKELVKDYHSGIIKDSGSLITLIKPGFVTEGRKK